MILFIARIVAGIEVISRKFSWHVSRDESVGHWVIYKLIDMQIGPCGTVFRARLEESLEGDGRSEYTQKPE